VVPGAGVQPGCLGAGRAGAHITFDGAEHLSTHYEVLCGGPGFPWAYAPFAPAGPSGAPNWGADFPVVDRPKVAARLGYVPPGLAQVLTHPDLIRERGAKPESRLEFHAVVCGREASGDSIFCAVAAHGGGLLPGKVSRRLLGANIGWRGVEIDSVNPYSVLCDASVGFRDAVASGLPEGATPVGEDVDGAPLFLARCPTGLPGLQIGKIRADWAAEGARVGYGGLEVIVPDYQVLFAHQGVTHWAPADGGAVPDGALAVGCEADGAPLFAARILAERGPGHEGPRVGPQVGKVRPGFGGAKFAFAGREITVAHYEVLVAEVLVAPGARGL
jgi:hypothetical protein